SVVSTSPENGQTSVYPGEISISFTTSLVLRSENEYSISISPPPANEMVLDSSFPTQNISYGVIGGLERNTTYTMSISASSGQPVHSWSFTTSNEEPESSSGEVLLEQERLINEFYPLFYDVPYESDTFRIDYADRL